MTHAARCDLRSRRRRRRTHSPSVSNDLSPRAAHLIIGVCDVLLSRATCALLGAVSKPLVLMGNPKHRGLGVRVAVSKASWRISHVRLIQ